MKNISVIYRETDKKICDISKNKSLKCLKTCLNLKIIMN